MGGDWGVQTPILLPIIGHTNTEGQRMEDTGIKVVGPNKDTDWYHEVWQFGWDGWELVGSFLPMGSAVAYAEQLVDEGAH